MATSPAPAAPATPSRLAVRSVVRRQFARPPADLVARIAAADVTTLSERVGRMYTMGPDVRPLALPARAVCGVASTVKCPPGDNLGLVRALSLVAPGDVLVVDAQGFAHWCLGGFELLRHARDTRGLAGLVVNGAWRDVAEAREAAFPVYATAVAAFSGPKAGPFEVNVPVCCGGVVVHPGDVVSASDEGVVVVPRRSLAAVADALPVPGSGGGHDPARLQPLFDLADRADCELLPDSG